MKIKEAVEIYNKYSSMKSFKEFVKKLKEIEDGIYESNFEARFKWRFCNILDELKDLADVAIKEYEEVLDGEYEKD